MIKKIKNFISNLFGIKHCACPEEDQPIVLHDPKPCKGHRRFRNNCEDCREVSA